MKKYLQTTFFSALWLSTTQLLSMCAITTKILKNLLPMMLITNVMLSLLASYQASPTLRNSTSGYIIEIYSLFFCLQSASIINSTQYYLNPLKYYCIALMESSKTLISSVKNKLHSLFSLLLRLNFIKWAFPFTRNCGLR